MSQSTAIEISKIDYKQFKCVTSNGKTYFNGVRNQTICVVVKNLTQLGMFNPKLLPEANYNNKSINIHKDDLKKSDYDALMNINNYFANNKEIRKSFNIPENVKYSNLVSNDILRLYLNMEYNTDNVRTSFINKDNNNVVNYSDINDVYKYFSLGNELELYFTFTIPNADYSTKKFWNVNLKVEQVKYKMTQNIDAQAELKNASLFVNKKSDNTINLISFFDIDVNEIKGENTSFNNQEYTLIKYGDTTTHFALEPTVNNYGLPSKTKFINGIKSDTPDLDRALKFKLSIVDEKTKAKFREIDEHIRNNENIKKLANISKKHSKNYKPLLTDPSIDAEDDEKQKLPYINLKFEKNYNNGDISIKTKFSVNGKPVEVKKIEDLDNIIKYQCLVTPTAFRFGKMMKINSTNEWGPTLIVTSMDIISAKSNIIYSLEEHKDEIVDVSSDEEEIPQIKSSIVVKQSKLVKEVPIKESTKQKVEEKQTKSSKIFRAKPKESSDDESEVINKIKDDSDSDEEVVTVTKKIPAKPIKQIKKVDIESDESDEEPVKVVTKSKTKVATK